VGHLVRARFSPSIEGGYSYQNLFSIPIQGFDFLAIAAADTNDPHTSLRVGGAVGASFGTTEGGLHTTTTSIGPFVEGHFDRIRVGGGLRIGTFNSTRATDGPSLFNLSAGVYVRTTFDLIQFDRDGAGALFLFGRASVDAVGGPLYGLNAGLGARF
jgi:hypothetical protein